MEESPNTGNACLPRTEISYFMSTTSRAWSISHRFHFQPRSKHTFPHHLWKLCSKAWYKFTFISWPGNLSFLLEKNKMVFGSWSHAMIIFNLSWDLTSTEPFVKKETSYSLHSTAILVGDEMIIPPFASIFQEESIESGKKFTV